MSCSSVRPSACSFRELFRPANLTLCNSKSAMISTTYAPVAPIVFLPSRLRKADFSPRAPPVTSRVFPHLGPGFPDSRLSSPLPLRYIMQLPDIPHGRRPLPHGTPPRVRLAAVDKLLGILTGMFRRARDAQFFRMHTDDGSDRELGTQVAASATTS